MPQTARNTTTPAPGRAAIRVESEREETWCSPTTRGERTMRSDQPASTLNTSFLRIYATLDLVTRRSGEEPVKITFQSF